MNSLVKVKLKKRVISKKKTMKIKYQFPQITRNHIRNHHHQVINIHRDVLLTVDEMSLLYTSIYGLVTSVYGVVTSIYGVVTSIYVYARLLMCPAAYPAAPMEGRSETSMREGGRIYRMNNPLEWRSVLITSNHCKYEYTN